MPEIDPNAKALRRRSVEMLKAAQDCPDVDSQALLLFYSAECGLKALYMINNGLKTVMQETASVNSARSFGHRLDRLVVALKIRPTDLLKLPVPLKLRSGVGIQVHQLHESWRYGEKVDEHGRLSGAG